MKQKLLFIASIVVFAFLAAPDAGAQWEHVNFPFSGSTNAFAVKDSILFGGTSNEGVWKSTNNGAWYSASNGLTSKFVHALAVGGTNASSPILFAGTDTGGVFLSTNNGDNWTAANNGLTNSSIYALTTSGTNLFTGTGNGVFLSTNNGASWTPASTGLPASVTVYTLAVKGTKLFAGTSSGAFLSTDNGTSWTPIDNGLTSPNTPVYSLAVKGSYLFAGSNGAGGENVFVSSDNGTTWIPAGLGISPGTPITCFAVDTSILFAATLQSGVFRSTDNGAHWDSVNQGYQADLYTTALGIFGGYLFLGTGTDGVWKRPLAEMTGSNAVAESAQPVEHAAQIYPNPFPEKTSVRFTMAERGPAQVTIVNLLGQQVAQLFNGELDAGEHLLEWNASGAAAGTYFCIVRLSDGVERAAMVLTR